MYCAARAIARRFRTRMTERGRWDGLLQCRHGPCDSSDHLRVHLKSVSSTSTLRRLGKQRLGAVEKNPARSDVLVGALGHVAAMRVSKRGRCDEQRASPRQDSALLIKKLRL